MSRLQSPTLRIFKGLAGFLVIILLTAGCGKTTSKPQAEIVKADQPQVFLPGFLGDYSQLQQDEVDPAALVYINPDAKWTSYGSVIVEPVQFWSSDNEVPATDQAVLVSYLFNALSENLQKNFNLVDRPGPEVMRVEVAIAGAPSSVQELTSISAMVPQDRVVDAAQSLASVSYAHIGSARAECRVTDTATGKRLMAAVFGPEAEVTKTEASQWQWSDARKVLDYWAQKIPKRIIDAKSSSEKH